MDPAQASGMLGYVSGELVKSLGAEKAKEVADQIEKIVHEETRSP